MACELKRYIIQDRSEALFELYHNEVGSANKTIEKYNLSLDDVALQRSLQAPNLP